MFIFETLAVIMFFPTVFLVIKRMCKSSSNVINWSFDTIDDWIRRIIRGKDS